MDELMTDAPVAAASESGETFDRHKSSGLMGPPPRPLDRPDSALRGGGNPSRYYTAAEDIQRQLRYSSSLSLHGQSGLSRSYLGESWETTGGTGGNDDDESSDWSNYGDVPNVTDDWDRALTLVEGSDQWNSRQTKVHQLIFMRGVHPMIPSTWKMSYKMWGIGQPQLEHVFAPVNSKKRVVISALSPNGEIAAAKALEALFYLSQRVMDYENQLAFDKMEPVVVKAISTYIKWALKDAGIDAKLFPPMFFVHAYPINNPGFHMEGSDNGEDESPRRSGDCESTKTKGIPSKANDRRETGSETSNSDDESESDDEETRRFTVWMDQSIHVKMQALGQRWREFLSYEQSSQRDSSAETARVEPPTLFGFAVVQHAVIIASHDTSSADNPVVVLGRIALNDRGLWLWNALSLAIPINVGKKQAAEINSALQEELGDMRRSSEDDPDL